MLSHFLNLGLTVSTFFCYQILKDKWFVVSHDGSMYGIFTYMNSWVYGKCRWIYCGFREGLVQDPLLILVVTSHLKTCEWSTFTVVLCFFLFTWLVLSARKMGQLFLGVKTVVFYQPPKGLRSTKNQKMAGFPWESRPQKGWNLSRRKNQTGYSTTEWVRQMSSSGLIWIIFVN